MKSRVEVHTFSPEQIADLCVFAAKAQIVDGLFLGDIGKSTVTVLLDGSIEVRTPVNEGTWSDVIVAGFAT